MVSDNNYAFGLSVGVGAIRNMIMVKFKIKNIERGKENVFLFFCK